MSQMDGNGLGVINNCMSDGHCKVSLKSAFFLPHFCAVNGANISCTLTRGEAIRLVPLLCCGHIMPHFHFALVG